MVIANKIELTIKVDAIQLKQDLKDLIRLTKMYPEMADGLLQMVRSNIIIEEKIKHHGGDVT